MQKRSRIEGKYITPPAGFKPLLDWSPALFDLA
jgi:hypothetical protein